MIKRFTLPRGPGLSKIWPALRLAAVAVILVLAPTIALSPASPQEGGPKVAALFTQVVSQGNWDPGGYAAFSAMAKKYKLQPSYVENASYEKAPAILRDLASKGVAMIICHSSGYSAAIEEVAPQFPNTQFVLFSYAASTKGLPNYAAWSMDWDQYGYVVGVLAAASSAKHHVAIVAGQPIPSEKRSIEFMTKGAKAVDPGVQVEAVYTGSWTDVAKAKEIALQAIGRGADFLVPAADTADAGTQQAAEENRGLTMGEYIDQSGSYPKSVVSSTLLNFAKAYDEIGQAYVDHKLHSQIVQMSVARRDMTLQKPFKHVSPNVESMVIKVMDEIASGKLDVEK
jgi:basic membrane protein A